MPHDPAHDPAHDGPAHDGPAHDGPAPQTGREADRDGLLDHVPVWIAGRTYLARPSADLDAVAARLRAADGRTLGLAALTELPRLFRPGDAADLFTRLDDPRDPLEEVGLHRALLNACKQLDEAALHARLLVQFHLEPRPGGGYLPVVRSGGLRRELTAETAREHASAVMAVVARAEHDRRLLWHLVTNVRMRARAAVELIEREIAAGRRPVDQRALHPLRIRAELSPRGDARLHLWAPAAAGMPEGSEVWPLSRGRAYACEVLAQVELAAVHAVTEAWLSGPGGLDEVQASHVLAMMTEQV